MERPLLNLVRTVRLRARSPRLALGVAAIAALLAASRHVHADCLPAVPLSGTTVTCTGSQNTTYTVSDLGSLTVDMQATNFNANPAFVALRIGVLTITSTNSNLQSVTITEVSNLFFEIIGGNVNGGITVSQGGISQLINRTNINGLVNFSGAQNTVDNFGTFNQGLVLFGTTSNTVTNNAGATINGTFSLDSPLGHNMVSNAGTINNGLTLSGNGTSFVENLPGGTINVGVTSTGAASDQFLMLGGTVNGEVKQGAGDDKAEVRDGTITGFVRSEAGKDVFLWTGGFIGGLDMGTEDDVATFRGLTPTNLKSGLLVDGGLGFDKLTWDNTVGGEVGRYVNWELFELTNKSQLTFDNSRTLTLGDSGTGTLSIDPTSTVFAGDGTHAIVPFSSALFATLMNAGTIDLTNGSGGPTDSLRIRGNYIGQGGRLKLNTVLASDGAPSDKLVIDGGTGTGTTSMFIFNAGGGGARTVANGILVVEAINGATTATGAFALGAPAVAGPYQYELFRGSKDASAPESWFLRTEPPCPPSPITPTVPTVPVAPIPPTTPTTPITPTTPAPPGTEANFRQEVSLYAALPPLALLYGRAVVDTLHQRVGEQEQLRGRADLGGSPIGNGAWGRIIGQRGHRDGGCPFKLGPTYDFDFAALQAGLDVYRLQHRDGARDHVGLYAVLGTGRSSVTDDSGNFAGRDYLAAYSLGAYWTHFGASGWYVDSVVQGTFYDTKAQSTRQAALETSGLGFAASLEGGYPFKVFGLTVEPQAQVLYQTISLDGASDIAASVRFTDVESLAGRLGVRFANTWPMPWRSQPSLLTAWFRPSIWQDFLGDPKTLFSSATGFVPFRPNLGDEWVELSSGITLRLDRTTSLYATGSYQIDLDGRGDAWDGKFGLRVNW